MQHLPLHIFWRCSENICLTTGDQLVSWGCVSRSPAAVLHGAPGKACQDVWLACLPLCIWSKQDYKAEKCLWPSCAGCCGIEARCGSTADRLQGLKSHQGAWCQASACLQSHLLGLQLSPDTVRTQMPFGNACVLWHTQLLSHTACCASCQHCASMWHFSFRVHYRKAEEHHQAAAAGWHVQFHTAKGWRLLCQLVRECTSNSALTRPVSTCPLLGPMQT